MTNQSASEEWPVEAWPDGEDLLVAAQEIPGRAEDRKLFSYIPVIRELRGKGWSYRDIAAWFRDRGAPLSDSKLYRLYQPYSGLDDSAFEHVYEVEEQEWDISEEIERWGLGGVAEHEPSREVNDERSRPTTVGERSSLIH